MLLGASLFIHFVQLMDILAHVCGVILVVLWYYNVSAIRGVKNRHVMMGAGTSQNQDQMVVDDVHPISNTLSPCTCTLLISDFTAMAISATRLQSSSAVSNTAGVFSHPNMATELERRLFHRLRRGLQHPAYCDRAADPGVHVTFLLCSLLMHLLTKAACLGGCCCDWRPQAGRANVSLLLLCYTACLRSQRLQVS